VHDDDYIDVYEPGQLVRFQNYLYIAAGSWGILIYDLSDVNNPELINTLDIICWEIVVDGNRLAVITSLDYNHINRLRLFDLTQPENPHYMGEIDLNWENRPTVFLSSANRGYIYGYGENREEIILLYIFDIGSEEAPILTGRMRLGFQSPRGISLAASGDRLYVKTERLIYLYDLADPAGPDSLGAVLVDSASYNDIAVSDNSLFISPGCTDGNDRHTPLNVQIYNVGPDAAPPLLKNNLPSICLLLECYPNPFNSTLTISYTLPIPSPVSLKVFDLSGREVATLTEGWREAGSYREVWEGKDAASGIYLLKGNFNKHQKIQTILLSR